MVTFDKSNPQCPKCNAPCSNDYRCRYCNCNMHWFCGVDGADGSELGHGAHYCCVDCGNKKDGGTLDKVITRSYKQQPQLASSNRKTSGCNSKRTTNGSKSIAVAGKRKGSGVDKGQAKKKASELPPLSLDDFNSNAVAQQEALQRSMQRSKIGTNERSGRKPLNKCGKTQAKNSGTDGRAASKSHKGPKRKAKNNSKIPPLSGDSASNVVGDQTAIVLSRAVAATKDREASPIAKSLFRHTLHRDVVDSCVEDSNTSDGLLVDDTSNDKPDFAADVENEVIDEIICDESFIDELGSEEELDLDTAVDRSMLQESWEVDIVEDERNDAAPMLHNNNYLKDLHRSGGLYLHQGQKIASIIESDNDVERKLFHLFMTKSFFTVVLKWTNKKLSLCHQSRGQHLDKISLDKLFAYVGLELGMSIIKYNDIGQYWSNNVLEGHTAFKSTMSRNNFELIRSLLSFYDPNSYDHNLSSLDPLWHSRSILEHFLRNCVEVATPTGPSALDEHSTATKARTTAKTYNANKPAKFAIRFYAVTGSVNPYISSFFDNRAGNKTNVCGAVEYTKIFRAIKTPYNYLFCNPEHRIMIEKDSPSALWLVQMAHQTKRVQDPSGKRVFFTDNFYTRHNLAHALKVMTDGEARMIGTVRLSLVDATNRYWLEQAVEIISKKERGSWCFVRAYDEHPDMTLLQRRHQSRNRGLPKSQRERFIPPLDYISPDAGYIVLLDKKVVIFYSNDLNGTAKDPISYDCDVDTINICRGLCPIYRWTGKEIMKRSSFLVPAPIIAYNQYMSGVDRMDQLRSTNITRRREKRLYMTLFTMALDLSVHQAYCVYMAAIPNPDHRKHKSIITFKQKIILSFIQPEMTNRSTSGNAQIANPVQILPTATRMARAITETLGSIAEPHMLVKNTGRKKNNNKPQDVPCYLCRIRGMQLKTIYGCPQCQVGFHVDCFTAYHYKNALKGNVRTLMDMIKTSELSGNKRDRKSKYISSVSAIVLPEAGAPCSNIRRALLAANNQCDTASETSALDEALSSTSSAIKDMDFSETNSADEIEKIPI